MVDVRALSAVAVVACIVIGFATSQERYQNPSILQERGKCALIVVRPILTMTSTLNPGRRTILSGRGPILPRPSPQRMRQIRRRIPRPIRTKRHAALREPPSRPPMPSRITLPDRGTGLPPRKIHVPVTGFGSQLPLTDVGLKTGQTGQFGRQIPTSQVKIPEIPNKQPTPIRKRTRPGTGVGQGSNQIKVPAIPNIPQNRIEDGPIVRVPGTTSRNPNRRRLVPRINLRLPCRAARRVCGWELDKSCRLPPCPTKPACVKPRGPINKPGKCPEFITTYLTNGFSIRYCFDDSNCRGKQICCHGKGPNGGSACVNPIFPTKEKIA